MNVYLNGEFMPIELAKVPVLDRGFIFGDGLYEVIPVYSRRPFRLDEHLARLQAGCDAIRLPNPHDAARWRGIVERLIALNPWDDQSVYLHLTRGVAPREHAFPQGLKPTVFMMSNPLAQPAAALVERGVSAITAQDLRWLRCDIKSVSLLGNCWLRTLAADAGCAETILLRDGQLTEGSTANVFIVSGSRVIAPPKSHLMLPGVTYDVVVELLAANAIAHELRPVAEAELRAAGEIWLTSSSKEVLAVTTLDGRPVGTGSPGEHFRRMLALYQEFKAKVMRAASAAPGRQAVA